MRMRGLAVLASLAALLVSAPVLGQGSCSDGTVLDDGTFENGYGYNSALLGRFAQAFDVPVTSKFEKACVCWQRLNSDSTLEFFVDIFSDAGGKPGTLLGGSAAQTALGVPFGFAGKFYSVDMAPKNIVLPAGRYWVVADYSGLFETGDFFLCADESPSTPLAPMWSSGSGGITWTAMDPDARALGIRATFTPSSEQPSCVKDADTACLQNGRFEVSGTFNNASSNGPAQVMSFGGQRAENTETAFLYFTSATNFEMGVKVLDACTFNGKFWVFISGLTNQGWNLTVRDTETGAVKNYSNARDHLTATVADTAAFNCD